METLTAIYLGPPDYEMADRGSAYTSKQMRSCTEEAGVIPNEALNETRRSIHMVARYHAPLPLIYKQIPMDKNRHKNDAD